MKKLFLIPIIVLLTGCATVTTPVEHSLPEPSKVLTESCPALIKLSDNEDRLSELLKVVTTNYTLYHECGTKHELLVKWYNEQKALHDALFNKR